MKTRKPPTVSATTLLRGQKLILTLHLTLMATLALNAFLEGAPWVIYLLTQLPLAILLPGVIAGGNRGLIWLGFVLMLYFMMAVNSLAGAAPTRLDWVELALVSALFLIAMRVARWRQTATII
jgi:uncharacterized membrane protein